MSEWSDVVRGRTQRETFETCGWKECPYNVSVLRKYSIDEKNPRVATKNFMDGLCCTIIGDTPFSINRMASWGIKVLKSKYGYGDGIFIGVAPFDIDQNEGYNHEKCGWYFDCYESTLLSGPPHNYKEKEYGPRKIRGQYVRTGDSVGVVMDTTKGELSFVLNEVNLGVAYEGVPLDNPLVPCVVLKYEGDSVELVI